MQLDAIQETIHQTSIKEQIPAITRKKAIKTFIASCIQQIQHSLRSCFQTMLIHRKFKIQ